MIILTCADKTAKSQDNPPGLERNRGKLGAASTLRVSRGIGWLVWLDFLCLFHLSETRPGLCSIPAHVGDTRRGATAVGRAM